MIDFIQKHFTATSLIKVGITVAIFLIIMTIMKIMIRSYFKKSGTRQTQVILSKIVSFIGFSILFIIITNQLGFSSIFTTVLGTAGIAGVVIGFASKTSLENIISGFLLLSDKSFKIDDIINVDGEEGTVEAIDSLSVKIRTYDNKIVRIPNVKILNSNVTNLYPNNERRKDFYFVVAYNTDLLKVESILKDIAHKNLYSIKKDETYIYFNNFKDLGYEIKYGVWFRKGDITILTNTITQDINRVFSSENIEIPSPILNRSIENIMIRN